MAIVFASRRVLSDVFGEAHILSTKSFLADDIIAVNETAGTVEEIGLRCTTLRDFDRRLITLSNSTTADSVVINISSEPTRGVKTFLGIPYDTDSTEIQKPWDYSKRR